MIYMPSYLTSSVLDYRGTQLHVVKGSLTLTKLCKISNYFKNNMLRHKKAGPGVA